MSKKTFSITAAASALLLVSASAWAQGTAAVKIQPSDTDAKPFMAQGSEVINVVTTDKNRSRVLMQLDAAARTVSFTEFTQSPKGELERLKVSTLKPAELRPLGEYGTRIEVEQNSHFGGQVHVLALICTGQTDCVAEQDHNSVNGEAADKAERTFFKAHFKSAADAQRVLAQVRKLR